MSYISDHARVADIMGDAFEGQAALCHGERGPLLMSIATAYRVAAEQMRSASLSEAQAFSAARNCTLNHAQTVKPCPACGAK